jgi:transposase
VRLGPISKRGNGYPRRLLVNGATSLIKSQHVRQDPWVAKLLASKSRKVVSVALANKLARIGWALMTRQEDFRIRPVVA